MHTNVGSGARPAWAWVLVVATIAAVAAWLPTAESVTFDGVFKIGAPQTITGPFANQAKSQNETWSMWLDLVNNGNGLMFGGKRYKAEIIPIDVDNSYAIAGQVAEMLVKDHNVSMLFAPYGSTLTPAVAEVGDRLKVPVISGHSAAEGVFVNTDTGRRRFEYLVGVNSPASTYFSDFIDLMAIKQAKTLYIISEDAAFTEWAALGAKRSAQDRSIKVVGQYVIPRINEITINTTVPMEEALKAAQASGADVLVSAVYSMGCTYLIQAAKQLDYFPNAWALSICIGSAALTNTLGRDVDYLYGPAQWDWRLKGREYSEDTTSATVRHYSSTTTPAPKLFCAAYVQANNIAPTYQAASSMAMGYVVEASLQLAPEANADGIMRAMSQLYDPSFYGRISFSYAGVDVFKSMVTYQYQNSVSVGCDGSEENGENTEIVTPLSAATAEVVYPAPSWSDRQYTRVLFDRTEEKVIVVVTVTLMVMTACISCIFFRHRKKKIVVAANPLFLQLMLLAAMITYAAVLTWPADSTYATCKAMPWLFVNGQVLFTGCLLAKNYRICKVMTNKAFRKVRIHVRQLLMVVATIQGIEMLLAAAWYLVGPPTLKLVAVDPHRPAFDFHECELTTPESRPIVAVIGIYSALVGIVCCVVAFLSRKAPSEYNESRHIALATYNIALGGVIFMGLSLSEVASDPKLRPTWYVLRALLFLVVVTGTIVAVFFPKLLWLWYETHGIDVQQLDREQSSKRMKAHSGVASGVSRGRRNQRRPSHNSRSGSSHRSGRSGTSSSSASRSAPARGGVLSSTSSPKPKPPALPSASARDTVNPLELKSVEMKSQNNNNNDSN